MRGQRNLIRAQKHQAYREQRFRERIRRENELDDWDDIPTLGEFFGAMVVAAVFILVLSIIFA